jgi:hypothetical protein
MDIRERLEDPRGVFQVALDGRQMAIWTALPGIVASFDPTDCTASINPAIKGSILNPDNSVVNVPLPMLQKCPVQFPGGGGFLITSPLAEGDEVIVIFSSRCLDSWWKNGGVQPPLVLRMHSLSDGFCIPVVHSVPQAPTPPISTTAVEIRAGSEILMSLSPAGIIANVLITANMGVIVPAGHDVIAGDISLVSHLTSAVQNGSDVSGVPVP